MVNAALSLLQNIGFTVSHYERLFTFGDDVMTELKTSGQSFMRYEHAAQEDRSAPRVRLGIPATMRPSAASGFKVIVKDLSLSGVACEALTGMKAGTRVWLTLPGLSSLQAEIMWNDGTMVGCAFTNLLNPAVLENVLARFPVLDS